MTEYKVDHRKRNNQATIIGKVLTPFRYKKSENGIRYYMSKLSVERLSEVADVIPIMVSHKLVNTKRDYTGMTVRVKGDFRSCNEDQGSVSRLILYVFVREWEIWNFPEIEKDRNEIYLDGYVCREPVYRTTPGGREITDLMLAVNRPYGEVDYIPGICWGKTARYVSGSMSVGSHIQVRGKIQSREYTKYTADSVAEKRTAYEVSVDRIHPVETHGRKN